jgi:hypothetical protein
MAKPNPSFQKRLRERKKAERKEEKARKKAERKAAKAAGDQPDVIDPAGGEPEPPPDEPPASP